MIETGKLQLGRKVALVVRTNEVQSEKMKTYSTILQFQRTVVGEFGKAVVLEAYFGIALTEKKPDLKPGEAVNVEIVKYITSENPADGRENMQAHCLLLSRAKLPEPERVEAVKDDVAVNK